MSDAEPAEGYVAKLWPQLAALVPGADPARINEELDRIYSDAAIADMNARQPGQTDTRERMEGLWKAYERLPTSALQVLVAQLREDLEGAGIAVPEHVRDPELGHVLMVAIFRATLNTRAKPPAQKGLGARRFHAFDRLIDLYCSETGQGKPYYDKRSEEWRRTASVSFAIEVMCAWSLWRDGADSADGILKSWAEEHERIRKGISTWARFAPS